MNGYKTDYKYFAADTESTQPKTKEEAKNFKTRVWACGYAEIGTENEKIYNNLFSMFKSIADEVEKQTAVVYFHNLAFDGSLIVNWLLKEMKYRLSDNEFRPKDKEFTVSISDKGMWYCIRFKMRDSNNKLKSIQLRDSLKILPFKVDVISKSLKTKYKKLVGEIDYTIDRPEGWVITKEEYKYLRNDILIMAEALKMIEPYGLLEKLTIGSCCLEDYKSRQTKFDHYFPVLSGELDGEIRKSYHGGWCYVKEAIQNQVLDMEGYTYDVNSLYPSVMNSDNLYPHGELFYHSTDGSEFYKYENYLYFVKIKVDFTIKPNHLPFIQIKHSIFRDNEYLKTSDGIVELTMTKPDYELFHEQYYCEYEEIEEFWVFKAVKGKSLFGSYIDHWFEMKEKATMEKNPVLRTIAKLMLNNLYGKLSTSTKSGSKKPFINDEGKISYFMLEKDRDGIYIPAGSYVTSYARCKTIRSAQANYDIFCYADTDSLHMTGKANNLDIDDTKLGYWAVESHWEKARFVRQKTYIELTDNGTDIKACGMPDSCKDRLKYDVKEGEKIEIDENGKIITPLRDTTELFNMFTYGLILTGKLVRRQVEGGTILINDTFRIR